jgi:hypothetical protein
MFKSPTRIDALSPSWPPPDCPHLVDETELVLELGVDFGVGLVAACRHIKLCRRCVLPPASNLTDKCRLSSTPKKRRFSTISIGRRESNGDAVIALLAVDRDVLVTQCAEWLEWKQLVRALRFLQTENVRPVLGKELFNQRRARRTELMFQVATEKGMRL